jgi:hypothetical protein
MTKQKIALITFVLFVSIFSDLFCQEGIKWKQDENVNWRDTRISLSLYYSNPIITSNESGEGISHFDNSIALDLSLEKVFSDKNYWGLELSYERYKFSDDYMNLNHSQSDNILHSLGIGFTIDYMMINGKSVYLSMLSVAKIDYIFGDNRESKDRNGFDFPSIGFGIATGPNLGINIIKDYDLHFGAALNFRYYGQIVFKPNFYVSISKWIN